MADVDFLTATLIVMLTIIISIVLLTVVAPIIDKADYAIGNIDARDFPAAGKVLHMIHDYFYYIVVALNLILIIWYVKLAFAVHTYTRTREFNR